MRINKEQEMTKQVLTLNEYAELGRDLSVGGLPEHVVEQNPRLTIYSTGDFFLGESYHIYKSLEYGRVDGSHKDFFVPIVDMKGVDEFCVFVEIGKTRKKTTKIRRWEGGFLEEETLEEQQYDSNTLRANPSKSLALTYSKSLFQNNLQQFHTSAFISGDTERFSTEFERFKMHHRLGWVEKNHTNEIIMKIN